jgi:hypothetical protein
LKGDPVDRSIGHGSDGGDYRAPAPSRASFFSRLGNTGISGYAGPSTVTVGLICIFDDQNYPLVPILWVFSSLE